MSANRLFAIARVASVAGVLTGASLFAQAPQPSMPSQQPQQQPTTPGMGPGQYPGAEPTAVNSGDRAFISKALEGGDTEVQLGQLAQQKSQSEDVKQFGQKMVSEHGQMADKWFKPVAQQLGVSVPNGPSKKEKKMIAQLQGLSGAEFDAQYIAMMVKDHQEDLKEFQEQAKVAQDPNVKQIAERGTTVISQHLQLIEQIAKNHNVSVESRSSM
jgi:putative membrane protein